MIKYDIEAAFDPTDADAASAVAHACVKVFLYGARALWSEQHGMRIGRDDSRELSVALMQLAEQLGLIKPRVTGASVDAFFKNLLAETGIVDEEQPKL
jgi:hypothetical protein